MPPTTSKTMVVVSVPSSSDPLASPDDESPESSDHESPESPDAEFDTFIGMGEGRLNNVNGYGLYFKFTDDGQPGVGDTMHVVITDPAGEEIRNVEGYLTYGNHQAHSN